MAHAAKREEMTEADDAAKAAAKQAEKDEKEAAKADAEAAKEHEKAKKSEKVAKRRLDVLQDKGKFPTDVLRVAIQRKELALLDDCTLDELEEELGRRGGV